MREVENKTPQQQQSEILSWASDPEPSDARLYFDFDPSNGFITNRLRKNRVFILASDLWSDMEAGMEEIFGSASDVVIMKMGYAYGSSLANKLKPYSSSFSVLRKLAMSAGMGKFTIQADEENGSWIKVDVHQCVFCHNSNTKNKCTFLSGVVQGMAEVFYARRYTILSRKCLDFSEEDHLCQIILQAPVVRRK